MDGLTTTVTNEVTTARGGGVNLNARLDDFDDDISLLGNAELPGQTGNADKYLATNGSTSEWRDDVDPLLPSQTGNTGKFLSTNGSTSEWRDVIASASSVFVNYSLM